MSARKRVLLIEDNRADARLMAKALARLDAAVDLWVVGDGAEAQEYLRGASRCGADSDAIPDLIFLDLNLPGVDGRSILRDRQADPDWPSVPIVVLSSSRAATDITASYQLGAWSYVRKPVDYPGFVRMVKLALDYWLDTVVPAPRPSAKR